MSFKASLDLRKSYIKHYSNIRLTLLPMPTFLVFVVLLRDTLLAAVVLRFIEFQQVLSLLYLIFQSYSIFFADQRSV